MNDRDAAAAQGLLLKNALVLDYFPVALDAAPRPRVVRTDLRLRGERIVERGADLVPGPGEDVRDLRGVTVLPGNVNAHAHLYAAMLAGMPLAGRRLESFADILTEIWWPLDRSLDTEAVGLSAAAGAWDAVRCGTTLLFDHHASLACVDGALDLVEQGLETIGLRGCLSYEVTDRGGKGQRDVTLQENERYLQKLSDRPDHGVARYRGLVGGHASFTLEDRTLELLEGLCSRYGVGLHAHLGEGATDREVSRDRGWKDPLARLDSYGLVRRGSLFAHGVDLSPLDMQLLEEKGAWLIHCGRSNMNNGVGRAPVDRFPQRCGIGTDGLDDNMWGELRTTYFRGHEGGRGPLSHADAARFWLGNYALAREVFGEPFGSLDAGAPADLIVLHNFQKTPLSEDTWLSHLLTDFHPWDIQEVWVGGRRVYRSGDEPPIDPAAVQASAARVWRSMGLDG
ncbi:MAG: amidohydrolase family protein [Krumholzibacteria bacterium]|nr:amidohydrolase family protein [Candidatus Krumholzibacteria bacterium]